MSRLTLAVMFAVFAMLMPFHESDAKPFFGLDFFDPSIASNGTTLLAALAASHAQHSLDALQQLADLSSSFFEG